MGSVPFSFPLSTPLLNLHPLSSFMLSPGPFRPRGVDQEREWKGEEWAGQMWFGALSCPPFLDRWRLQRCLSKTNKPQQFEIIHRKWGCRSICDLCFKTTWWNRSRVSPFYFRGKERLCPLANATQLVSGLGLENKFLPEDKLWTNILCSVIITARFPQDGVISFFRDKKRGLEQSCNSSRASSTSFLARCFSVHWATSIKTISTWMLSLPLLLHLQHRVHVSVLALGCNITWD